MKHAQRSQVTERVSRVVKILLARDGLNQADLAEILGYDASTVTRAMKGERNWSAQDIQQLAETFEVSPGLFFEEPDSLVRIRCFRPELVTA